MAHLQERAEGRAGVRLAVVIHMSNRVRILIENTDYDSDVTHRTVTQGFFAEPDFKLTDILEVMESALRGHGFHCPLHALVVVKEDEDICKREKV